MAVRKRRARRERRGIGTHASMRGWEVGTDRGAARRTVGLDRESGVEEMNDAARPCTRAGEAERAEHSMVATATAQLS
jgi:hypothetical protein